MGCWRVGVVMMMVSSRAWGADGAQATVTPGEVQEDAGAQEASADETQRRRPRRVSPAAVARVFTPYGLIKPTVVVSAGAAESFGRPNMSAITAAANPMVVADPERTEFTFQVAQSRVGLKVNDAGVIRAQLELDFIDFDKSSPTVASVPRLRIAQVEWDPAPHHTVALGQGWDLFSPMMPHHFDLVGAHFTSGNAGFMRQEIQYRYHPDHFEVAVAVGMPGVNTGPSIGPLERGTMPAFVARVVASPGDHIAVGLHGFVTQSAPTPTDKLLTWAAAINAEVKGGAGLVVRAEAYVGQNTANTGMLTLAYGRPGVNVRDAGGYVSVKVPASPHFLPYLTAGAAAVLNPDDVAAAYVAVTESAAAARLSTVGPGISWNAQGRLGAEVPVVSGLAFVAEGFVVYTRHQLLPGEVVDPLRRAGGVEAGAIYRF